MQQEPTLGGAMTVAEFCATYNIGRTFLYQQIKEGRLAARKAGTRTLIERSEAERWLRSLPVIKTAVAA